MTLLTFPCGKEGIAPGTCHPVADLSHINLLRISLAGCIDCHPVTAENEMGFLDGHLWGTSFSSQFLAQTLQQRFLFNELILLFSRESIFNHYQ